MPRISAVVTTGIYCRPGCPARPHPEHVRGYDTAAAAEAAGFRACHRCRPYRLDQPVGVTGPQLVGRAVRLVLDGALDRGTETDLGTRLGISPRHLRRLFVEHVGVTPNQLARSRRAHFARRLLDDTDLSITQVAYAAGFGSVRQLNRACADIFRAPPRDLRDRRRLADRLVADGGLALRLGFSGELAWDAMLGFLAARAALGVERVDERGYRRTIEVDGDPGVLELQPGGPDHVVLRAHLPHWEGLIHVVHRARAILNLDLDVVACEAHLDADPVIGPLVAARTGLRVPGTWDPWEVAVRAIVGQQVSVAGATTLLGRIVARHGRPVPGLAALGLTHLFPSAEVLAKADLDGLGLTGARIAAIHAVAAAVERGDVRLDGGEGLDGLTRSLERLPGIGPWTAQYVALRMGEPDAFPATDLVLRRALPDVATRAEAWRPWRATAAMHVWANA